ncbi:hypothetical protein [Yoonia sp. I 8.24]|uniref:hypothetical protein n=1 Tax=Yoonia sp. I 8.24 TaxID=1537229 RepID=UPI001EDD6AFF|nr:hypothetical protein [Yoonia sp. I 8.24]MCG3267415.1 hypothetical protein [Yoonia sp. I 8.24]
MKAKQLVLHIGSPKTGTTMLQHALADSADYLREQSVLLPDCARAQGGNAITLGYEIFNTSLFERDRVAWLGCSHQEAIESAKSSWKVLQNGARAGEVDQILISAEQFMCAMPPDAFANARKHFESIADETKIVAYLRSPAAFFLSLHQEGLKVVLPPARGKRPANMPRDMNSALVAQFKRHLGDNVSLNVYHRDTLHQSDIVTDFCKRYLPKVDPQHMTRKNGSMNTSISAEAMAIAMDLRSGRIDIQSRAVPLRKLLIGNDKALPNSTRPKLLNNAQHSITNWFTPDLISLRDQHGVVFPDVDYDALDPDDLDNDIIEYQRVEQICAVDPDRKAALLRRIQLKAKLPFPISRWAAKW